MSEMDRPIPEYAYGPCPGCGAKNADEAERLCKPTSDETGEYYCPADNGKEDEAGAFMFITQASLDADAAYWKGLGI